MKWRHFDNNHNNLRDERVQFKKSRQLLLAERCPSDGPEALRRHRVRKAKERLRMGRDWQDHALVCCDTLGRPLSPRRLSRAFPALCRRLGLGVDYHGLRHGFASMLLASEVHPKIVQTALGHSTVQITLDVYSHLLPGMGRDAANKIDSAIRTHLERAPSAVS